MRPLLLSLTLLAALTLAASNQFGGGSFGGASAGRVNRAPVAVATGAERAGPGTVQLDGSASTDEGIVGGGFPSSLSYVWTDPYDPDGVCEITAGQLTDTVTVTMSNDTGCCMMNLFVSDGRRSDAMDVLACVSEDQPPTVSASMVPVTEPNALTLSGSATDDSGGTCGSGLTCTWTCPTVPAGDAGSIADASAEDTSYSPTVAGGYECRLCANDGVNSDRCDDTGLINVASSGATCVPEAAGFAHFDICAGGDDPFAAGRWATGSTAIAADLITSGWPDDWQYDAADDVIYLEATGSAVRGAAVYLTDLASVDANACFEVDELPSGGTWNFGNLIRAGDVDDDFRTYYPRVNESSEIVWESFDDLEIFQTVNGPAAQSISVGDVFCVRVTGEEGNETRAAYFDPDYPASADPTTWTPLDHEFTSPDGVVSSGLTIGVRAFLSAGTTGRIALKNWGAGSTEPEGPPEEAVLTLTPTSVSRSMEEGETVLDALFQVCNDGNVVLDDWSFDVEGTPDDITDDSDSPNTGWLGASDSDTNLAPDTCENVTATITGEENGDPGSYSGEVCASTTDPDSTVAEVCRTVSLLINEPGTGGITVNLVCEGPTNKVAPVAMHCDAKGTVHESPSVDVIHDLHYSWSTSGCNETGFWGDETAWGNDANPYIQKYPRNRYEGGPIFPAIAYEAGTCTVSVTARDQDGNTGSDTFQFTATDPDTVFSGTDTACIGNGSVTAGAGGCPSGAQVVQNESDCSNAFNAVSGGFNNKRILFERGGSWSGHCASMGGSGPTMVGAFGTGAEPSFSVGNNTNFTGTYTNVRFVDLDFSAGSSSGTNKQFDPDDNGSDLLILRVEVDGGFYGTSFAGDGFPRWAIVDSVFENSGPIDPCSYNIFGRAPDRGAIIGTRTPNSACHNVRIPRAVNFLMAFNAATPSGRGNWRIHGTDSEGGSQFLVFGYNSGSDSQITVASPNLSTETDIDDVIVEGNFFPQGGPEINCGAGNYTARNNIVRKNTDNGTTAFRVWMRDSHNQHVGPCRYYNNTVYDFGTNSARLVRIHDQNSNFQSFAVAKGNLLYAPNATEASITDGDAAWTESDNVVITDPSECPFDVCPPGSGFGDVTDYDPNPSATNEQVIGAGFTATLSEPAIRDLENTPRSNPADVGAMED